MADPSTLAVERDGAIARVTINRPAARNALDRSTRRLMATAFDELDRDASVRVIVLTGSGTAFCAGVDLKESQPAAGDDRLAPLEPVAAPLDRCRKPVIAAINGPAMGGGLELALAADLRIASVTARFGLPEVRIGSLPGSGGIQRLVRAVAPAIAARMVLSGEAIDADEAHRIGLVSDVVDPDALQLRTVEVAGRIASNAPLSLMAAKKSLRAAAEGPLSVGLALDRALWAELATTEDRAEGRAAFREQRPPNFRGR